MPSKNEPTRFLDVDLDIGPVPDIDVLLGEWSSRVIVLQNRPDFVSLELSDDNGADADCRIAQYAGLVGSLSADGRDIWRSCKFRRMNIGIQAGVQPYSCEFKLSRRAIAALVEMDCEIVFTVYAVRPEPSI